MNIVKQSTSPAQEAHANILKLRYGLGMAFLALGEQCKEILEGKLYLELGSETFGEYLATVGLDRSTVYRCIDIFETFIVKYGIEQENLAQIGYSKLADITPHVNDENYAEWISKAESLSRSDLIEELRAEKEPKLECEHVWESAQICGNCKKVAPCDKVAK